MIFVGIVGRDDLKILFDQRFWPPVTDPDAATGGRNGVLNGRIDLQSPVILDPFVKNGGDLGPFGIIARFPFDQ